MNKIAIIIITYNNAQLICKQVELIRRFCKDDFDIVIIENSNVQDITDAIKYYNDTKLNCIYYKTLSTENNSSNGHTFAANFAYDKLKNNYDYFAFLDFDLFPLKDFSIKEILKDKVMAGLAQCKSKKYFWPGCLFFDNTKIDHDLIDFSINRELELDTGGNFYKVIEKYGEEACVFFDEAYEQNPYFNKSMYNFYAMINNKLFMHFINGSNWANALDNQDRINSLLNILDQKTK